MFSSPEPVIAMVHVGALPGTPASRASLRELEERAAMECAIYREAGVHGVALENMRDVPYLRGTVGPEITAAMTVLALAVKTAAGSLPCGIQILAGANREALAIAHAAAVSRPPAVGARCPHRRSSFTACPLHPPRLAPIL